MLFFPAQGCVYASEDAGTQGAIQLPDLPAGDSKAYVLVRELQLADSDMVVPVSTLDRKKILYTFGEAFGTITVHVLVLMGESGGSGSGLLSRTLQFFQDKRVTRTNQLLTVTAGGSAYGFALTEMQMNGARPELNIQPIALMGLIVTPPA